jgi:F0F1-type ATP synthase membrane subunit c/vacuolar-type H+-ATPase subunit K
LAAEDRRKKGRRAMMTPTPGAAWVTKPRSTSWKLVVCLIWIVAYVAIVVTMTAWFWSGGQAQMQQLTEDERLRRANEFGQMLPVMAFGAIAVIAGLVGGVLFVFRRPTLRS